MMNNVGKKSTVVVEEACTEKPVYFDEALALTGNGKYHHLLLLASGFCLICLISVSLNSAYLLPAAQCDFSMTSEQKGLLSSVLFMGMISSSLLWGYLADTKGRRNIILLTLCCDATVTIVSSFAHTYEFFLFCRFLNGFFICGPSAVVYAYLGEFQSNARRTRVIIWASTILNVGTIALPLLAWAVIPRDWTIQMPWHTTYNSWRIFVVLCSLPSMFTACLLGGCLKESPKFLLSRGKNEKALDVLRYVYAKNTGKHPDTYPVKEIRMDPSEEVATIRIADPKDKFAIFKTIYDQTAPLFQTPHLNKTVLACFIQFGLYASCNGFYLWLPDIFNQQSEFSNRYPNTSATICEKLTNLSFNDNPSDVSVSHYYFAANENEIYFNVSNEAAALFVNSNSTRYNVTNQSNDRSGEVVATDCVLHIDSAMFTNTLILGVVSTCGYIVVGLLVNIMQKKAILMIFLSIGAAACIGMYVASTPVLTSAMATCFVTFSGVCIVVLNSAVIDVFPTHLRAMAVCLSLMFGRLGTVFGALLMGVLLEVTCQTIFFILSGVLLACALLSWFFPSPKLKKMYAVND